MVRENPFLEKTKQWDILKDIYKKLNTRVRINYNRSNETQIKAEIKRLTANPIMEEKIKITKKPKRSLIWRELKEYTPIPRIRYGSVTEIENELKTQKNVNKAIHFLENPVNESRFEANVDVFLQVKNYLNIKLGWVLELAFEANGEVSYKIFKNVDEIKRMLDLISAGTEISNENVEGSDVEAIINFIEFGGLVEMTWYDSKKYHKTNGGAYFKYYHDLNLDLTKYQIYTKWEKVNHSPCILYALEQAGINEEDMIRLKGKIVENHVLFRKLPFIANFLNINIQLTSYEENKKEHLIKLFKGQVQRTAELREGSKNYNYIKIGCVDNHYFLNEQTDITYWAIHYHEQLKDHPLYPKLHYISNKRKPTLSKKYLTSFEVIKELYKLGDKHLKPISIENVNSYNHVEPFADYTKLRNPHKACNCKTELYNECHFPKEHKVNHMNFCSDSLCQLMSVDCQCKRSEYNEYKDYSKIHNPTLFKGNFKKVAKNPNLNFNLIFLDLETKIGDKGYHVPYCLSYAMVRFITTAEGLQETDDTNEYNFYGLDCVQQFLDSLTSDSVIIAHNLAFDFRGFVDHLTQLGKPIETGTKLKHIQCKYKKYHLVFKDNLAFLNFPLKELPPMFKLPSGDKDVYPYEFITKDNFESFIDIEEINNYPNYNKEFDKEGFYQNCIKTNSIIEKVDDSTGNVTDCSKNRLSNGKLLVDIKNYTIHYCNQDVNILKQSYLKFRQQIKEITKIDILNLISLPQLADMYFKSQGCHDYCFSLSGVAQDFIRKCAVGGRVMTAKNEKWHVKGEKINDFDANGLYPSGTTRLNGFLQGLPQVLTEQDIQNFTTDNFDYYFVEIEVNSVGLHRDFPLQSIKDQNGIRNFTNDLIGKTFHIDKTGLQDLVKFQLVTYKVIRGYKFTNGFNPKIRDLIKSLYQKRLEMKNEGNPIQQAYKLILNASYGKLIQKPIKTEKKFYSGDEVSIRNYLIRKVNTIDSYVRVNENLILLKTKKSIVDHFTPCHLACQILSMSKRIMNEVMCLAEDNNIQILYQDTDSMHLYDSDISKLINKYKQTYNKELEGNQLGQFSSDFNVKGADKNYPITSVESLFVGKKSYIDKLEYKQNGEIKHDYHIRCKGLPTSVIKDFDSDVMKTYRRFFDGEKIEFDLSKVCIMKMEKNYRVTKTKTFTRNVYFNSEKKNIFINRGNGYKYISRVQN